MQPPAYRAGRISSNNTGVIIDKITDRTKKKKRRGNSGRK